jgi:hypothetical protein
MNLAWGRTAASIVAVTVVFGTGACGGKAGSTSGAGLDAEGRLAELLVDVPAAGQTKPHQLKVAITQYGTSAVPAKPTGKAVIEAPANVYDIVNG